MYEGNGVRLMAPLVAAEVDLKDFPFTPIYRARLFGSEFHAAASDAGWRAGVTLWLKSWDQVPAGSLPPDEVSLCRLAELGRDLRTWRKIASEALHGWAEARDGRLYHKVVAEGVNDAWQRKCAQRDRTEAARVAKAQKRLSQSEKSSVTEIATEDVTGSKRQGQGQGHSSDAIASAADAPPRDPVKAMFDRGVAVFTGAGVDEPQARKILGQWRRDAGDPAVMAAILDCETTHPSEIVPYFVKCVEGHRKHRAKVYAGGVIPMHPGAGG